MEKLIATVGKTFTTRLEVDYTTNNAPFHSKGAIFDIPYEYIPDQPGVLVFHNEDGSAVTIEGCCVSMRQMAARAWQGFRGRERIAASHLSFVVCSEPVKQSVSLTSDHVRLYGKFPLRAAG